MVAAPEPEVRLAVLGALRAEVAGAPADLGGPRRRAVLARLAVADGEVVSSDRLISDLWPGEPAPRALAALQVHVSHLRRTLEPARPPRAPATVLVSTAPGYALRLPAGAVDARRFAGAVAAAGDLPPAEAEPLLRAALAEWSGPAFAEFAGEPWAGPAATAWDELRLVAAERLAEARMALDVPAVPELERLVHDHPLRENAVRLLALAMYRSGRQGDALAVLAAARRRLADELGVDPSPALRDLEGDILRHAEHVAAPRRPALVPAPSRYREPGPPAPEILGRDAELARLAAAAERATGSGLQLVLVSADAGGGKTALVEAARRDLAAAGWATATGRCPEVDGAPPGWAWSELIAGLPPAPPDLAARLAPLRAGAPDGTFWPAMALVEHLGALTAQSPVLLVLDDLHRADGDTLQLLRSVAGGLASAPVLVLATLRPAEVGPDLATALAALAGPVTDRIELRGLGVAAVTALLARHGVPGPDDRLAALVAERTGGNPLFVRETARLVAVEGPDAAEHEVPAGVRDVLRRRLARLPASAQTTLRQLAVLGREAEVELVVALASRLADGPPDEDPVLEALELGVLSGLLDEPGSGRVRFTHALVHATLYSDLPRLRRTRLHAAALDVTAAARPDDHSALAHHALAAGPAVPVERVLRHVPAAALAAAAAGAHREAARLWAAALARVGGDPGAAAEIGIGLVSALAHAGDVTGAVAARSAAVAAARTTERPDLLAAALAAYDAPVSWTIRQDRRVDPELVELLEDAIAATGTDTAAGVALRCRLLAALVFELEGADEARVRSASAEALALSAAGVEPAVRCAALNARFFAVLAPDLWHELAGVGEELLAVAGAAGLAGYRSQGHHLLFMEAAARLDLDSAQRHADAALEAATGGQLGFTLGWTASYGAMRALVAGRLAEAERAYLAVAGRLAAAGASNAEAFGALGRFAARHAMGRAADSVSDFGPLHLRIPVSVAEPYAVALLAAGRRDDAAAVWRPDLALPRDYYWLLWTAMRAEIAVGLGDRDVAARCYDDLTPYAGTLAGVSSGSVTLGPVAHVLADLAELLGLPEADAHRQAGDALARRLGALHWERAGRQAADGPMTSRSRLR